ncbi:hypothetical protein MPSEU_000983200 [Mayamaea pseudoterrestris]|nr:hypothetical protein MPSEU_000983200 [Mayamaea pseudoterrestris]
MASISRTRLLNAARGLLDSKNKSLGILRCFPLKRQHVETSPPTPADFHTTLCHLIRNAKQRVTLASLYIGPAADVVYEKEVELLNAIREASSNGVDVKILLDQHRALRLVPIKGSKSKNITSAEACKRVLNESGKIHLLSVLPPILDRLLPNPYNEIAGVFHIKAYIIDDHLILSGANLSEEYFVDRIDRYLWVTCPDLVQCYQDIVDALSDHGVEYCDHGRLLPPKTTRQQLLDALRAILTTTEANEYNLDSFHGVDDPVAYAVPTFHAPPSYVRRYSMFRNDHQVLKGILQEAAHQQEQLRIPLSCRISTAYLNPTDAFLKLLSPLQRTIFLTAGRVSHGFKPKPKAGNKGRDWIPTVFEHSAQLASQKLDNRPNWSFHAKGVWLTNECMTNKATDHDDPRLSADAHVYAVTHGSSNYGQRSAHRDMESNLFLILPEFSPLVKEHIDEWNALCEYSVSAESEGTRPILPQIRGAFPVIRYFF